MKLDNVTDGKITDGIKMFGEEELSIFSIKNIQEMTALEDKLNSGKFRRTVVIYLVSFIIYVLIHVQFILRKFINK